MLPVFENGEESFPLEFRLRLAYPLTAYTMRYFANLATGKVVLWCYLIWYLFFVSRYFDPSHTLWLTSVGISSIIGIALLLSTWHDQAKLVSWTTFRLFLMPFCVSSFSALVKGRQFFLVFSPRAWENIVGGCLCAAFCLFVFSTKRANRTTAKAPASQGPFRAP